MKNFNQQNNSLYAACVEKQEFANQINRTVFTLNEKNIYSFFPYKNIPPQNIAPHIFLFHGSSLQYFD